MTTGDRRRVRFDPHVHTGASHDASGSIHKVLRYCQNRSLDAVAITDHDTTAAARRALDIRYQYDLVVVPGVEISTADGHLLALGVADEPPIGRSLATTVEWTRERGGFAVIPHPFQRSRHGVSRRVLKDCDGVEGLEVFNAWAMTGLQNRRAATFARRHGYPGLGCSDAHRPDMVGTAHTELIVDNAELTADTILEAVARGRCRAVGESTATTDYLRRYADAVNRWMRIKRRRLDDLSNRLDLGR